MAERASPIDGGVLVLDIRDFTAAAEEAHNSLDFYTQLHQTYFPEVLDTLKPYQSHLKLMSYRGDGLLAAFDSACDARTLSRALQETCDRLSDQLKTEDCNWDTGIGVATRRLVDVRPVVGDPSGVVDDQEAWAANQGLVRWFTGPAFIRAVRITEKSRQRRAVFSPLLDERTVGQVKDGVFRIGRFIETYRREVEYPIPQHADVGRAETVTLWSLIPDGLEEIAGLFEEAVKQNEQSDRLVALEIFRDLRDRLYEKREPIESQDGGKAVFRRWKWAIDHYSALCLWDPAGRPGRDVTADRESDGDSDDGRRLDAEI